MTTWTLILIYAVGAHGVVGGRKSYRFHHIDGFTSEKSCKTAVLDLNAAGVVVQPDNYVCVAK